MSYAMHFKQSCIELYNELGDSTVLEEGSGLCYELNSRSYYDTYQIMASLLTELEYNQGLAKKGKYDKNRKCFLEFLAFVISEEDIEDCLNSYYLEV